MSNQSISRLMNFNPLESPSSLKRQSRKLNELLSLPLPVAPNMTQCIFCINCSNFILEDGVADHSIICFDLSPQTKQHAKDAILDQARGQLTSMLRLIETFDLKASMLSELQALKTLCKQLLGIHSSEQLYLISELIERARNQDALRVWQLRILLDKICFLAEMLKAGLEELELITIETEIENLKSELEIQRAAAATADGIVKRTERFTVISEEARESLDSEF